MSEIRAVDGVPTSGDLGAAEILTVSGVMPADGVYVHRTAAADYITMFRALERLYRGRGTPLPVPWRRRIAEFVAATGATTCVSASPQVVGVQRMSQSEVPELMTTKAVAESLGVSGSNVRDLYRRGRLVAMRYGKQLWFAPESVESYRAQRARKDD